MPEFRLRAGWEPKGDQPAAIAALSAGLQNGLRDQVLLGVTGSGKTFTVAGVIQNLQRPALVIAHNKTLAAQLCSEFKDFFPENAVEYFVSYYDYYQPEAYLPTSDTYIEKDSSINDEIDKLRHSATTALFERRDCIIVASVSCIYGLGSPEDYRDLCLSLRVGTQRNRREILHKLVDIQYTRNDQNLERGTFRARGDTLEIHPASFTERVIRVEFFDDLVERIREVDLLTGEIVGERQHVAVYPASHYVTAPEKLDRAMKSIEAELGVRLRALRDQGRLLEAQRLEQRTLNDLDMLREAGYCNGIENYSRHLTGRDAGQAPYTLLDFFPKDFLVFIDESHQTVPQIRGMYNGDRARKEPLVEYGFRLPSAFDNRPLRFPEFEERVTQVVYISATPGPYETQRAQQVARQIVRPTGLLDPRVEVRPVKGQMDDLLGEIRIRTERGERVLVTTLTKRMAEDLTEYFREMGVRVRYLHSEVETLERTAILRDLRLGVFDVLVGINLLREGLDLPEVSLVAILDADKEGFLRSETALIQTMGRAARNVEGMVILYADAVTDSMRRAMEETERRRGIQDEHNRAHGITPVSIKKAVRDLIEATRVVIPEIGDAFSAEKVPFRDVPKMLTKLRKEMKEASKLLEFERAAVLRDLIVELEKRKRA